MVGEGCWSPEPGGVASVLGTHSRRLLKQEGHSRGRQQDGALSRSSQGAMCLQSGEQGDCVGAQLTSPPKSLAFALCSGVTCKPC